jgi:hypothetical protein
VSYYLYLPWFFIVKDLDLSSPVDVGQVGGPNHLNPCVHFDCVFVVSFFLNLFWCLCYKKLMSEPEFYLARRICQGTCTAHQVCHSEVLFKSGGALFIVHRGTVHRTLLLFINTVHRVLFTGTVHGHCFKITGRKVLSTENIVV